MPEDAKQDSTSIWSVATKQNDSDWHWHEIFQNIHIALDTFNDTMQELYWQPRKALWIKHQRVSRRLFQHNNQKIKIKLPRKERHWLRRHGRRNVMLAGWDGSHPELQPLFEQDDLAKIYHSFINDIANNKTTSAELEVNQDAEAFRQAGAPAWEQTSWLPNHSHEGFNAINVHREPDLCWA